MTPEQQQLSDKAKSLKNFVNDCIARNANTANDVFLKLYGTNYKVPADPKQSIVSDILSYAYGFLSDLKFEGSDVVFWIIGGIINQYKQINEKDPNALPQLLAEDAADINERISRTLAQVYQDLAAIQQDPTTHWNDTYELPFGDKKTVVVSELLNYDIPDQDNRPVDYGNMLIKFKDGLTYQVAKSEIVTRSLYKIGFPLIINMVVGYYQSLIVNPESFQKGHDDIDWTPLITPYMIWKLDITNSEGNVIINRCPKENGGPAEVFHGYNGKYNPCSLEDWKKSAGDYSANICKSSFLNCYSTKIMSDNTNVLFYRTFYLIDGRYNYEQESYGDPTWYVAADSLCDWLFKDDGFGNIVNPTGITTREDVFLNWGLQGSKGIKAPLDTKTTWYNKFIKRIGFFIRKFC